MGTQETQQLKLKPSLSLFDATAISVGAIVGAGIFVVTGIAAGLAGSALIISMLIAAVISLFTASSFAELSAWQPKEGSIYEYTYQLISPFAGFLTGWMWILSNTFAGAAVSLGFAYYFTALYPNLPTIHVSILTFAPASYVAALICLAFTTINYYGVRQSALLNNFLVTAKLIILTFFIIFGLLYVRTTNFIPFNPFEAGVLYGACYIFFAYGGFARAAVIAEEVKDAKRNVPKAMILALIISTVFYILVGIVAVGLVGANKLASSDSPLHEAIGTTGNAAAVITISIGGLLATASVLLTSVIGVSRMAYAMARRKDLPQVLSKLHSKHNTPLYSIWIIGLVMTLLALIVDLSRVVAISTFALLFFYTLANVSALRLKIQRRAYPRIIPALGTITCLALFVSILFISPQAWLIGVVCLIIGIVFYFAKQQVRSKTGLQSE